MKNSTKNFFFGVVLWGSYSLGIVKPAQGTDFKSLQERSPFGDTPKPESKPQQSTPKVSTPSASSPPPKKPDMKLGFTGYMRIGNQNYYSIHDKTTKDEVHTILISGKSSPLGYVPGKFDAEKGTLEVKVNGYNYPCHIGEEEKKTNNSTPSTPAQPAYNDPLPQTGYPASGPNDDYYDYWDWDDWDDWDED